MKKRTLKIPLQFCKRMEDMPKDKVIETINYYVTCIDKIDYLIDIIGTKDKYFYVKITDVTGGKYKELDFNKFKSKYMQPSLYDFFDI